MENQCCSFCTVPGMKEAETSFSLLVLGCRQPGPGGPSSRREAGGSAGPSRVMRNDSPPAPQPPPLQREAGKHHKFSPLFVKVSFANTKCFPALNFWDALSTQFPASRSRDEPPSEPARPQLPRQLRSFPRI